MDRSCIVSICLALLLAGCSAAKAVTPDVSNPYHCGVALSVSQELARSAGEEKLAAEILNRRLWQASQASDRPGRTTSPREGTALRKRLLDRPEERLEMSAACMRKQDEDPAFRAARSGLDTI